MENNFADQKSTQNIQHKRVRYAMISIEIIIVTYNSAVWIDNCLKSIKECNYNLDLVSITFVDNNSQDNTLSVIQKYESYSLFGGFKLIKSDINQGFGTANNIGVRGTDKPYVLFLNVDTQLHKDSLTELSKAVLKSNSRVAMWEMRQSPHEHPKLYNPVTLETTWCSGASLLVNKDAFVKCGMFDEAIFMYAEDVDLSWRFRRNGFQLKYVPKSVVHHYTYMSKKEVKPRQLQESIINNLRLRYKHGSLLDILCGYVLIILYLLVGKNRNKLNRISTLRRMLSLNSVKIENWKRLDSDNDFKPLFYRFDYEIARKGAFYSSKPFSETPKVSVIVRTKNRIHLLKEALTSIYNQTYRHIEVIVIEDGEDTSSDMIINDFQDVLNIKYVSTGKTRGRSIAANIGLKQSTGDFLCFLDDDDLLFADHIEVLVSELMNNKQYKVAYSLAVEAQVSADLQKTICYKSVFDQRFNRYLLYNSNFLPIQTVMFSREVYNQLGGLDEAMNYLEDWDLWLKYSAKYEFKYIGKQTSIYKTPADLKIRYSRKNQLINAEKQLHQKHQGFIKGIREEEVEMGKKLVAQMRSVKSKLVKFTLREILWYTVYSFKNKYINREKSES